jgi:hypothetical protein
LATLHAKERRNGHERTPDREPRPGRRRRLDPSIRAKAVASEAVPILSATASDALFAYAMTGSAVASLAILVAPHLEMLLRCAAHGRG